MQKKNLQGRGEVQPGTLVREAVPARGGAPLAAALLGWIAGTAVQLQQPELASVRVYASILAVVLVVACLLAIKCIANKPAASSGPVLRVLLSMSLAVALGWTTCGLRAVVFDAQRLPPALEGRDITVTGMVGAMPQRSDAGLRFRLAVESAQLDGQPAAVPPQIYLSWYGGVVSDPALADGAWGGTSLQRLPPALRAGDRWRMTVRLKAPHGTRNPHGFDLELWMWEQGLQATGYVRAGPADPPPERLASTWQHPFERARQSVRDAIVERLGGADNPAGLRAAGVVAALATGDQAAIDRSDWDVFRATGVAHLMSISGLHVTMFAWGAALAVGWLWRRSAWLCLRLPAPTAALVGGVALAWAYAVFSGWGVPAQRTVWMLATVALLRLSGRRWPWPWVWLLACAVVVAVDPWALLQAGFWLSFVAVGVLFASGSARTGAFENTTKSIANFQTPTWTWSRFNSIFAALGRLVREQWLVTLALAPLSLLLFSQVSLVGLLANALAIPWVTLVVTPLALAGALWAPLWDAAAGAVHVLAVGLQALATLPWATVSVPTPPVWAGAAGVVGGVLLALRLPWTLRLLGVPLLLPALFWTLPAPADGEFELLAADIGQGNAVIVRTRSHALLYDTGPRYSAESDAGHRILVPLLRALGVKLDTVVVSHRDSDHAGGAAAVLATQPNAQLLASLEPGHPLREGGRNARCEAGQRWDWDGVRFEVLHPRPTDYAGTPRPNALSCVLRVATATRSVLLTGDIEQGQEARLLADAALQPADLLLVPHHGSKTSSSAAFLDAVRPPIAVVQAGYRNRFGHPAPPVLARYEARGIRVVDSARCGALTWVSGRPDEVRCHRVEQRRYWHHRID
jgi:competence protein ComEC